MHGNQVAPAHPSGAKGGEPQQGNGPEAPGSMQRWLQSVQDRWQDFREQHHSEAHAIERLHFTLQLALYVYDIASDVIVVSVSYTASQGGHDCRTSRPSGPPC